MIDKYKQALDEIERIIKKTTSGCFYEDIDGCCENCNMNMGSCSGANLHIIKDIINKVKE